MFPLLSMWQRHVWAQQDLWWLLDCGRRIGKSTVSWLRGIDTALHGGKVFWFCASEELADENWQMVCDFAAPYASRMNREQKGILWFGTEDGKGIFQRKSGFNRWAGRAGTANTMIFDEFQLVTKKLFNRALPSILTTSGNICGTLTPPETPEEFQQAEWLKQIIDQADTDGYATDKKKSSWFVSRKPTEAFDIAFILLMNDKGKAETTRTQSALKFYERCVAYHPRTGYTQRGKNADWKFYMDAAQASLDRDKDELTDFDYDREYNVRWSLDTSRLVYECVDGITRNEEYEYDSKYPVIWAVDRGEGLGYHVMLFINRIQVGERLIKDENNLYDDGYTVPIFSYRVFDEISTRNVISEDDMLNQSLEMSRNKGYRTPMHVIFDVRAPGYRAAIRDAGLTAIARSVGIEEGIRKIRRLDRKRLLQIHPRCTRLWQNMTNYSRDKNGFPIDDRDNDAADALRYGICVTETVAGIPNDTSLDNREMVVEATGNIAEAAGAYFLDF